MENLKYHIITYGCKLNENDSEKICGMVEELDYNKTDLFEEANLIIFNTCCIRENAEEKLFGKLGSLKNIKAKTGAIIAIGGCMMQEEHIIEKINQKYKFVDIIFGTHTLHRLKEHLQKKSLNKIQDVEHIDGEVHEGLPMVRSSKEVASVTIMYGCNNYCTYCIVPYVRGRERSRDKKDILNEIQGLAKSGYKEIILLGQNVNSYKCEIDESTVYNFADLLHDVDKVDGIEKISFLSPHPKDFTDDVIFAIRDLKKVDRFIHLPLQSGSTNVLKAMNRKYSKEEFLNLADKIRKEVPDVRFGTDIIVGFPGETEEDFLDTLDVVKQVGFKQVFMFIYSRRVGTVADKMENQIPDEIKHKRFDRLKSLVEQVVK